MCALIDGLVSAEVADLKVLLEQGRQKHPRYAIVDSQSSKTQYHSNERGIDGRILSASHSMIQIMLDRLC